MLSFSGWVSWQAPVLPLDDGGEECSGPFSRYPHSPSTPLNATVTPAESPDDQRANDEIMAGAPSLSSDEVLEETAEGVGKNVGGENGNCAGDDEFAAGQAARGVSTEVSNEEAPELSGQEESSQELAGERGEKSGHAVSFDLPEVPRDVLFGLRAMRDESECGSAVLDKEPVFA